ncbi:MAG: hypothetical protein ACOVOR_03665 [Rhabdochlamydiaceae bacterium]
MKLKTKVLFFLVAFNFITINYAQAKNEQTPPSHNPSTIHNNQDKDGCPKIYCHPKKEKPARCYPKVQKTAPKFGAPLAKKPKRCYAICQKSKKACCEQKILPNTCTPTYAWK